VPTSRREAIVWTAAFLIGTSAIVLSGFTSGDPDSDLYASISDRLSQEPVARWVAPEWWGFWPEANMTGLFREHPAGVFWLPAALGRLGMPPRQGAYVAGVAAGLASLLLIASVVSRLSGGDDARAAMVLLQLMPVAFIFRIRANHEYPMLFALVLMLVGLSRVAASWRWSALVVAGLVIGLLVKGVFVILLLAAAALWVVVNPTGEPRARIRGVTAITGGVAAMAAVIWLYDWQYARVTGETFWARYWERQLAPLTIATPVEGGSTLLHHVSFYVSRLLWHPAPWSLALVGALFSYRATLISRWLQLPVAARRGVLFAFAFALASLVVLSPASRFAERYVFSATYAVGTVGAVVAYRRWPRVREAIRRADAAVPALPAVVWIVLLLARLALGPLLPRI
jgi:4-amino-4-deoxy-L-arabinose transferase-like glycosyltransferase